MHPEGPGGGGGGLLGAGAITSSFQITSTILTSCWTNSVQLNSVHDNVSCGILNAAVARGRIFVLKSTPPPPVVLSRHAMQDVMLLLLLLLPLVLMVY